MTATVAQTHGRHINAGIQNDAGRDRSRRPSHLNSRKSSVRNVVSGAAGVIASRRAIISGPVISGTVVVIGVTTGLAGRDRADGAHDPGERGGRRRITSSIMTAVMPVPTRRAEIRDAAGQSRRRDFLGGGRRRAGERRASHSQSHHRNRRQNDTPAGRKFNIPARHLKYPPMTFRALAPGPLRPIQRQPSARNRVPDPVPGPPRQIVTVIHRAFRLSLLECNRL